MKKIFVTGMMICLAGGMFGCSSTSNIKVETNDNTGITNNVSNNSNEEVKISSSREEIEAIALNLLPEGYRKSNFTEVMTLVNTEYIEHMALEEAGQRFMEVVDRLTYLPEKAYNLLKKNNVVIYVAEDLGVCYEGVTGIPADGNEEELYGGRYTEDVYGNSFVFISADDIGSSLYHEIGHAVDNLSDTSENLGYRSDSDEFFALYIEEKDSSKWLDMSSFDYYTQSATEYFAQSFQIYCDSMYFGKTVEECYNSIPLTMKYIDSMMSNS